MQVTMKDRVAVITGGSKGIGLAVARQFAASGAKVAILARGAADLKAARELLAKDGIEVRDYVCDVSKAADIAKAHDKIVADLGPVDILVNNAGTARTMAFENITDEAWQEDLDLKLFAAIRFSRLVWPGMKARKWGRIINVLNTYAKAPAASSAPTSVSRAAGMALTKVMASEGGEHNILVNAMLVGLIMSDQWVQRHAKQAPDMDFEVFAKNLAKGTPLGAHRHGGGIRQPGVLPRLRAGIVHHRHRHQCRWRPLAGGVADIAWPILRDARCMRALLRMRSSQVPHGEERGTAARLEPWSAERRRARDPGRASAPNKKAPVAGGLFAFLRPRPWRP